MTSCPQVLIRSTAMLALGALATFGCADPTKPPVESAGPPSAPVPTPPPPAFAGSSLDGRWTIAGPAVGGVAGVIVNVVEAKTGGVEGGWQAGSGWVLDGLVQTAGVSIIEVAGSRRRNADVTLFLVQKGKPFAFGDPFMTFTGVMVSANRIDGGLFVSDGSGYFGDNGTGTSVEMVRVPQ